IVGVLALLAWAVGAGSLVSFISETVMTGFKAGVALHLASTQLPKLFGFKGAHGDFWERIGYFLGHLSDTNRASLALGLAALGVLALGKRFLPNRPVALFVVIAGIASAGALGLAARGVALLGEVPQGLPVPGLPAMHLSDVNALLPLALACFMLGAVETAAIGRMFARKHGHPLDSHQERLPPPRARDRPPGAALPGGPPAGPAAAGPGGDRAHGRHRTVQGVRAAPAVAVQPGRVRGGRGRRPGRPRLGPRAGA